jgi:7-keto-8-aminopelargonate synthetase-like enzyme
MLRVERGRQRIVVSETLFSMDGDVADVDGLVALAREHGALTVVDDAHAIGAWGERGRGLAPAGVDVVIGTFGKALGAAGAFAACSETMAELLWNRARPLVFSTAMPSVIAAAAIAAIALAQSAEGDAMRHALREQIGTLGRGSRQITPVVVGDDRRTMEATARLLADGLFVQGIRPPTVPEGTSRLRISVTSGHAAADVARLREALEKLASEGLVPRGTSTGV